MAIVEYGTILGELRCLKEIFARQADGGAAARAALLRAHGTRPEVMAEAAATLASEGPGGKKPDEHLARAMRQRCPGGKPDAGLLQSIQLGEAGPTE